MKKIYLIALCALTSYFSFAQSLPHYMTAKEKALMEKMNKSPESTPASSDVNITPPQKKVRTIAEWEKLQGLQITWTSYPTMLTEIVRAAKEECRVYIVCTDPATVQSYLESHGVDTVNVSFVKTKFNSVWCRDYGPWSAYTNDVDSLYTIDWKYNRPRPSDDTVPYTLGRLLHTPVYTTTTTPWKLVNTGGNFMTDGFGTGFASKLILNENSSLSSAEVDTIMKKFMGITTYIKMNTLPYDEIHHIDMHMKLLDEETLLVGQYPAGVADGPQIEANLNYILANFKSVFGTPFKVIRIPMPDDRGKYPSNGGRYFTYTNASFINKTLIYPTYGIPADTTAYRIFKEALPGYKIIGINSLSSIGALGALHCITKEIGEEHPLLISHQALPNTTNTTKPYTLKAYLKHSSGIRSARIYWRTDTLQAYKAVVMSKVSGSPVYWTGSIPAQAAGKTVYYYIQATANDGKVQNRPLPAPAGYWHFAVTSSAAIQPFTIKAPAPNPARGFVTLGIQSKNNIQVSIDICTVNKTKLIEVFHGITDGDKMVKADISKLTPGMYLIVYRSDDYETTGSLIVE